MNSPLKVLGGLWLAVTIPVIGVGIILHNEVSKVQPVVITKTVVVAPTASPSATIVPTVSIKASSVKTVNPTVKTTVK